jgi:phosphatidylethanolamine-binding protein (PEBP) family uncharacterized protein
MSFRKYGGLNYAASNNIVRNHYSNNDNQSITNVLGQNNSNIVCASNIDLSGKDNFYNEEPTVIITNANQNKLYMVTMTDPDAPNGEGKQDNFIFTHWVYTQSNIDKTDKTEKNEKQIYVPYSPPTPPKGTHRYQFRLYDITENKNKNVNVNLNMNNNDNKMNYFSNKLINLNDKIIYFDVKNTQFIVSKQ